ncbi:Translation elongation factor 1 beta [Phlyctochytrium planicorne]|nr:Translation elongation factor 1 beta [Phlyctochytrium planicorne]
MGFADLDKDAGVATLNSFLEDKSYIEGYTPSQADVAVFEALKGAPNADKHPHAARWYKHIAAHGGKGAKFPGTKKAASAYGPAGAAPAAAKEEDEDDIDLFGSDDEEEDAAKAALTAQRLKEYNEKKAAKPKPAAKSLVVLDVKPWDDETDMKAMEESVRGIAMDGLVWGSSKLVAIGYGIKKLQINVVIEDEKVSVDDLSEQISGFEDYVQSVDVASFNKL